jgi:hypothetical protein
MMTFIEKGSVVDPNPKESVSLAGSESENKVRIWLDTKLGPDTVVEDESYERHH